MAQNKGLPPLPTITSLISALNALTNTLQSNSGQPAGNTVPPASPLFPTSCIDAGVSTGGDVQTLIDNLADWQDNILAGNILFVTVGGTLYKRIIISNTGSRIVFTPLLGNLRVPPGAPYAIQRISSSVNPEPIRNTGIKTVFFLLFASKFDLNRDGNVNALDITEFSRLRAGLQPSPSSLIPYTNELLQQADFNQDGSLTDADMGLLAAAIGAGTPGGIPAVSLTNIADCWPLSLTQGFQTMTLTVEATYGAATLPVRVHVRSSFNGFDYDTVDFDTWDMPLTANATVRKTASYPNIAPMYLKIVLENLDPAIAVKTAKVSASTGV